MNALLNAVTQLSLEGLSELKSSVDFVNCNPRVPNDFNSND